MTNAEIIMRQSLDLMQDGVLQPTGRTITAVVINAEGEEEEREFQEPEEIHTYAGWKDRGYQVQKGEHAIAQFTIWKHVTKKSKEDAEQEERKMFMKKASWFKASQVAPIQEEVSK